MNKKNVRTGVVAAVLLVGLLIGASFALAQDSEEPPQASNAATVESIAEDFESDVAPLVDEIKEKALTAVEEAEESGALTQEEAEAARDHVEGYHLPEGFPFAPRFPWFNMEGFEPECFGFGSGDEDKPEECPDFDLPKDFPFHGHGFGFGPIPEDFDFEEKWENLSEEIEGFVDGLDFDLEQLQELLESGMSPEEALEEMDIDLETILSGARDGVVDKIDELVAEGTISAEEAERIKEQIEGIDFSADFPFGLQGLDFDDFDGFGPHGHGFFDDHHDEEGSDGD
jgi:polyhydroxyalkanoate synthesis regulator phasin